MKRLVKKLLHAAGFEILTLSTAEEFLLAGNLRRLFRHFDVGLVLDVGANEGQYHEFMRSQVGFGGAIVSFEPIPALAERLKREAEREPGWEVRQLALGAARGSGQFNVAGSSQVSSFLTFAENTRHVPVVAVETVAIDTINNLGPELFREIPPERCFLKLDTQGFDMEVLRGAGPTLGRLPCLTTEVPFIHIYENMPGFETCFAFIRDQGFDLAGMWPTSRDKQFRAREFDCLYVNRRMTEEKPFATT